MNYNIHKLFTLMFHLLKYIKNQLYIAFIHLISKTTSIGAREGIISQQVNFH
jgi:hypothetical protein